MGAAAWGVLVVPLVSSWFAGSCAASALADPRILAMRGRNDGARVIVALHPPGHWIARGLAPGAARERSAQAERRVAAQIVRRLDPIGCVVVRVPAGTGAAEFAQALEATLDYRLVEIDRLVPVASAPNDPLYPAQWHLAKLGAPIAWQFTVGVPEVVVAVADSGIDLDHPDLAALLVPGYNAVDDQPQAEGGLVDGLTDHGTEVAGCVAASTNNAVGIAGLCQNVRLMPIRVSNQPDDMAFISEINAGAIWAAEHGAAVVNASFSGVESPSVELTGDYLAALGTHYVWAAGNSAATLGSVDPEGVVVIGATTTTDALAPFSNTGQAIDLVAPGVGIQTTKLNGGYAAPNGTSFAAPIASGALALVRSANRALSREAAEFVLRATAKDLGPPGDDSTFGAGRVDVGAAVALAVQAQGGPLPPSAVDDLVWVVDRDGPTVLRPLANDLDLNGDDFALASFDASDAHGLVVAGPPDADGGPTLLYVPSACFQGFASISYSIVDTTGLADQGMISLGVSDPPTFDGGTTYAAPGFANPNRLEPADIDDDGDLDLLAAYISPLGTVTVFRNDGGSFVDSGSLNVAQFSSVSIDVADVVATSCPDLIVAESLANRLTVLPGACGGFGPPIVTTITQPAAFAARSVDGLGFDANNDGFGDLVVAQGGFPTVLNVLLGNGSGSFSSGGSLSIAPSPTRLALADMNGDGRPEAISAASGSGELRVTEITPSGDLVAISVQTATAAVADLAIADVDGDGALDVVVASSGSIGTLVGFAVHLNDGTGHLLAPIAVSSPGSVPTGLGVADFDLDGDMDVALAHLLSNDVVLYAGLDAGGQNAILPVPKVLASVSSPADVAVLDADGDGDPDLAAAVTAIGVKQIRVFHSSSGRGRSPDFDGDGMVDGEDLGELLAAWGTAAGDLDADGATDGSDLSILMASWGACS